MGLEERSYGGKIFRPTPDIHVENDGSFGVIATAWGARQGAKRVIEILTDFIQSARQDMEATSPFQKLTSLSPLANNLRVGVMLANDSLYREENKAEYLSGVEVLVFARQAGELAFAQVGYPHIFLARTGFPWMPLGTQNDLSTEWSEAGDMLPPLPGNLIGLNPTSNVYVTSLKTKPGDRLVFLSHTIMAHAMNSTPFENTNIDQISETLSKNYPQMPFWLGVLNLA